MKISAAVIGIIENIRFRLFKISKGGKICHREMADLVLGERFVGGGWKLREEMKAVLC